MIVFELHDPLVRPSPGEMFGLWNPLPVVVQPASFSVPVTAVTPEAEAVLWRVNVPADFGLAAAQLARQTTWLDASSQAIEGTVQRLQVLADSSAASSSGLHSFAAVSSSIILPLPERELLATLETLRQPSLSFGVGETLARGWEEAVAQFERFMAWVRRVISHFAHIDTQMGGHRLALTTVDWTGDVATICQAGLSREEMMLHARALALALNSRDVLLRNLVVVVQGALDIAARLSLPGGPILALPALWRFVQRVLELQREQQMAPEFQ